MTNSGDLFADELTEWSLEACFIKPQCQMFIYYKYAPYGSKMVVLSYVDDCVYWYTTKSIGICFMDTLGKIIPCEHLGIFTFVHVNKNFLR